MLETIGPSSVKSKRGSQRIDPSNKRVKKNGRIALRYLLSLSAVVALLSFAGNAYAAGGTGVLYMYSDPGGASLLPQGGGIQGYILPATGTTVYVQIKGITESSALTDGTLVSGHTNIILQYNDGVNDHVMTISGVSVTNGNTAIVPWIVGTFTDTDGQNLVTISACETGIVFYGTTGNHKFQSKSNGGSNGGHFLGPGSNYIGTTCVPPRDVPEFGSESIALVVSAAGMVVALAMRKRATATGA